MQLQIILPDGEALVADSSALVLKNNDANTAIVLFVDRPDAQPLVLAAYEGAFLATLVQTSTPVPGLCAVPVTEESSAK